MNHYKVLITTSGTWSRLGELTKYTNKALIKIGWREIIRYIIDLYPEDTEIVVTLGYFGEKVKQFLVSAYPARRFTFVDVDRYEWHESSLGYSMLCARKYLQTPFIFHCNDTLVNVYSPSVENNWAWWHAVTDSTQYTTFRVKGEDVVMYNTNKWALDFDYAHIGLAGILEYEKFWDILNDAYEKNPGNLSLNDVYVLHSMLNTGSKIKYIGFTEWLDTGNQESLSIAEEKMGTLLI